MFREQKNSIRNGVLEMMEHAVPFLCIVLMMCFIFYRSILQTVAVCFILYLAGIFWTMASVRFRFSFAHVQSVIFFSALVSRLLYCMSVSKNTLQTSDFGRLLEMAGTGDFKAAQLYYRMFPHKLFYPLVLHAIHLDTQTRIFALQSVCIAVTAVFIYRTGKEAGTEGTGIFAAILYILWPVQIFYASVISEEHVAAMVTMVFIYLLLRTGQFGIQEETAEGNKDNTKLRYILAGLPLGVLGGIGSLFKDWCMIVIIAYAVTLMFAVKKKEKRVKFLAVAFIVCILAGRTFCRKVFLDMGGYVIGVPMNGSNLPCYMYVSLNPYSNGGYNPELYGRYYDIAQKYGYDYDTANKEALKELGHAVAASSPGTMAALLIRKGRSAYEDDGEVFYWPYVQLINHSQPHIETMFNAVAKADKIFYLMICTGTVVSCICYRKDRKRYLNFMLILVISGGILLSLIIECQCRYKYSIQTVWCILAANGLGSAKAVPKCFLRSIQGGKKGLVKRR